MLSEDATARLLSSDDFPVPAEHHAAEALDRAPPGGALRVGIATPVPLAQDHTGT